MALAVRDQTSGDLKSTTLTTAEVPSSIVGRSSRFTEQKVSEDDRFMQLLQKIGDLQTQMKASEAQHRASEARSAAQHKILLNQINDLSTKLDK